MLCRSRLFGLSALIALLSCAATSADAAVNRRPVRHRARAHRRVAKPAPNTLPCGTVFDFQVRLDRASFSPGEIDGQLGDNLRRTVAAYQVTHKLEPSGNPECSTWAALGGDAAPPSTVQYQLTDADVKGPFEPHIPDKIEAQANLPALSYRSPLERVAERFHVSPGLLTKMNPKAQFAAGQTIRVPAVQPFDPDATPKAAADAPDVVIQVTKGDSALRVLGADNQLLFYAPVSSGSVHDPLPVGDWTVMLVKWHPVFRYNPKLFWDADPKNTRAVIKPGPNGPVGLVWIGLSLEHYGIHGTPDPENVGHAQSHGCVRLTNWDAARVAAMVRKGTAVHFREAAQPPS